MPPRAAQESHYVRALDRGLTIITAFNAERPELSVSDVAEITGITRAAARRFLLTLLDLGYVSSGGRTFTLTPKVLELGYSYLSVLSLPEIARPYMSALVEEVGQGVSIAVLDGTESVNVGRVEKTDSLVRVSVPVGTRLPAFCNSMGRVLLAALSAEDLDRYFEAAVLEPRTPRTITDPEKLRKQLRKEAQRGYAVINQELEEGLISIAVPLHNLHSEVVAAMNLTMHAMRPEVRVMERDYLPPLKAAADKIDAALRAASMAG
jgi:IclR family transcriptional regulator, pca regulon regulatory protein